MKTNGKFLKFFLNNYLLCALSGVVMGICITFWQAYLVAMVALVPFVFCIFKHSSIKRTILMFFVYAFCFYLVSYNWFLSLHPLDWMGIENTQSLIAAISIWVVVSFLHTLGFSALGAIFALFRSKGVAQILLFCALYLVWEYIQTLSQLAFPWAMLSLTQYGLLQNIQSAKLFGGYFITLIVLVVNCLLAYSIINNAYKKLFISLALGVFLGNFAFGQISLMLPLKPQNSIKIAAIQANINPLEKWNEDAHQTLNKYIELSTLAASQGAQIIVWPETAIPLEVEVGGARDLLFSQTASNLNVGLVVGCFSFNAELEPTNTLVFYSPSGENVGSYAKRALVPMGEYVPGGKLLELVNKFIPNLSAKDNLAQGQTAAAITINGATLAPLVCYDTVFAKFSMQSTALGAQVLSISTNDAYYRTRFNPMQHYGHATIRAVESSRFVIRAANTGISGIITQNGKSVKTLALNEEGFLIADIALINKRSFYHKTGDLLQYAAVAVCLYFIVYKTYTLISPRFIKR